MANPTEEVIELPAVDDKFEGGDHFELTAAEAALGLTVYKEVDDLDDESDGILHSPGQEY